MTLVTSLRKRINDIDHLISRYEIVMRSASPAEMRSLREHLRTLKQLREKVRLKLIGTNGSDVKSI